MQLELGKHITAEWLNDIQQEVTVHATGSNPVVPNVGVDKKSSI